MDINNEKKPSSGGKYKGLIIVFLFAVVATTAGKISGTLIKNGLEADEEQTTETTTEVITENQPVSTEEQLVEAETTEVPSEYVEKSQFSASGVFDNHEYIVCNGNFTIKEAEERQIPGYHLATITSTDEFFSIMGLIDLLDNQSKGYWLGANDEDKEGDFKWCTGEKFDYNQWPPDQPDNNDVNTGGPENYLGIWTDGIWNDFSENEELGFVLEKDSVDDKEFSVSGKYGNHEYIVCNAEIEATEAAEIDIPGYHLASITSIGEHDFIMSLIDQLDNKSDGFWLGASDVDEEGDFKWYTGEQFNFNKWPPEQPDNKDADTGGPENYLGIWNDGIWNDFSGKQKFGFVLEKD